MAGVADEDSWAVADILGRDVDMTRSAASSALFRARSFTMDPG